MEGSRQASASSIPSSARVADILGIKVMRLTKPSFQQFHPIYSEQEDILGDTFQSFQDTDIRSVPSLRGAQPGMALQLPKTFGKLFLGETFSAIVAVHNETTQAASKVNIKVELLTRSQRHVLLQPYFVQQLDGGASLERTVSHEVHELEDHSLVVSVSYSHVNGEEGLLKRSFRIPVIKPLDVKTTHCAVEEDGDILFEIQIENLMPSPFVLELFKFEPADNCSVMSCSQVGQSSSGSVFGPHQWIKPRNTRQYLYKISPSAWPSPRMARDGHSYCSIRVGKVDIAWQSCFGEKGRIQTSQLEAKVERSRELVVLVSEQPGSVFLERPFTIVCTVKNISKSKMLLKTLLPRHHSSSVLWSGLSGENLGELSPSTEKDYSFQLVAIQPGLQDIWGLEFSDQISGKSFLMRRAKVFVNVDQVVAH